MESTPTIICGRCATVCDHDDNFCKRCGMALSDEQLPLKREQRLPVVSQPRVPAAVVRAVAIVAVGTLTEMMARRIAREAGRRVASAVRLPIGRKQPVALRPVDDDPQVVSDTVFIRRIQMRR